MLIDIFAICDMLNFKLAAYYPMAKNSCVIGNQKHIYHLTIL